MNLPASIFPFLNLPPLNLVFRAVDRIECGLIQIGGSGDKFAAFLKLNVCGQCRIDCLFFGFELAEPHGLLDEVLIEFKRGDDAAPPLSTLEL
ncbi:MAG: hypothetical protein FWD53_01020 [Phycisphaerales bacterium]|nr:hypothetical protein [Phycisphaerales bacterium]